MNGIVKLNINTFRERIYPIVLISFEIRNKDGKALAEVSMIDYGVVYLAELSLGEKILMSGVCVALLLQEQI
jgi:hypothetical protein